jgi:hypothetical protein
MKIDSRWFLPLAIVVSTAVGAAAASTWRRRNHRTARDREHTTELKSWENEGGNLAPAHEAPVLP